MRRLFCMSEELTAYATLCVGFLLLVVSLRTDVGTALFDEDRLFFKVPDSIPKPALRLELNSTGGVQVLRIRTENFVFANMCELPRADEPLVGHAHLYIDGRKIGSVYEPQAFLPQLSELPPGNHRITVSLNILPDHSAITVDGMPVSSDIDFFVADPGV